MPKSKLVIYISLLVASGFFGFGGIFYLNHKDQVSNIPLADWISAIPYLLISFLVIFLVIVLPLNWLAKKVGGKVLIIYFAILFFSYASFFSLACNCLAESCIMSGLGVIILGPILGFSALGQLLILLVMGRNYYRL